MRKDRAVRNRLEAQPPKDFADIVLIEEGVVPVGKPKRRPKIRRDKRHVEADEYIAIDFETGDKVVKTGKREALARGVEHVEVVLEEDEFIDEFEVVRTGWKNQDRVERAISARPMKVRGM